MAAIMCQTISSAVVLGSTVSPQRLTVLPGQSKIFGQKVIVKLALKRDTRGTQLVVRAASPQVDENIKEKIDAATEVCKEGPANECAAAWDEIEEISEEASQAKVRQATKDPLEEFCKTNPETDECRVYED